MHIYNKIRSQIEEIVAGLKLADAGDFSPDFSKVTVEPPRDPSHGDMATNAAMVLSKQAGLKPRDLAEKLAPEIEKLELVTEVDIAGPGFINLRLCPSAWLAEIGALLATPETYGAQNVGQGRKVNVEYVSANPTGPLTLAHVRGGVLGDVLSNIMDFMGFEPFRDYIINDAGEQVATLARSTYQRYLEALGEETGDIPEGLYPGDYLVPVGEALAEKYGTQYQGKPEEEWLEIFRDFAIQEMMKLVVDDMHHLGIHHDVLTSEREVVDSGKVDEALRQLDEKGHVYQGTLPPPKGVDIAPEDWVAEELTLFRSTTFGDDQDRALKKPNGANTYFCNDIAYHLLKVQRSDDYLVLVVGKDHAGYAKRIKSVVAALTDGKAKFEVLFNDILKVYRDGDLVKMSKRAGTYVKVGDIIDEIGADTLRFMLLTRRHDQPLDLDLDKVKEQSKDNPVFYVNYAHARTCSVLRHAAEMFPNLDTSEAALANVDLSAMTEEADMELVKLLATYPRVLEQVVESHEPHRLAFYIIEVASTFHALWAKGNDTTVLRFLHEQDEALTARRLALVKAVQLVVRSAFKLFGVTPLNEMD